MKLWRWDCGQVLVALACAAIILNNMICYYGVHLIFNNGEEKEDEKHALDLVIIVDFVAFFALASFPFAGPMHYALGYIDAVRNGGQGGDPVHVHSNLILLLHDKGTEYIINMVLACGLLYTVGEACFFIPKMEQGVVYKVYYVFLIVANIAVFYFAVLLGILR